MGCYSFTANLGRANALNEDTTAQHEIEVMFLFNKGVKILL